MATDANHPTPHRPSPPQRNVGLTACRQMRWRSSRPGIPVATTRPACMDDDGADRRCGLALCRACWCFAPAITLRELSKLYPGTGHHTSGPSRSFCQDSTPTNSPAWQILHDGPSPYYWGLPWLLGWGRRPGRVSAKHCQNVWLFVQQYLVMLCFLLGCGRCGYQIPSADGILRLKIEYLRIIRTCHKGKRYRWIIRLRRNQ